MHLDMENVTVQNRKSAEQPKAKHEPTLADLYTLTVLIDKRLTSLEQDMKLRVSEIENSLDEAYKTIADQENSVKILQCHIQNLEKSQEKNKIEQELRSKEYSLLFHGIPQTETKELQEHTEHLVRSFITNTLRFPPAEMEKMQFSNVHRLPKRVSAVESRNNDRAKLAPSIVVKFSQMKDKTSILRLAPSARKFNAAITRHLHLAFQQQRKALLEKAKRLYKAKKKIRWTIVDSECCLFADEEQVFAD